MRKRFWGLLLGWGTSLVLSAEALTGIYQCRSLMLGAAARPNGLQVIFTTPSGNPEINPQSPFNGEFQFSPRAITPYQSYWVMSQWGVPADMGALTQTASFRLGIKRETNSNLTFTCNDAARLTIAPPQADSFTPLERTISEHQMLPGRGIAFYRLEP